MDREGGKGEWVERSAAREGGAQETSSEKERDKREKKKRTKREEKEAAESSLSLSRAMRFRRGAKRNAGERGVKGENRGGRIRRGARFSTKPIIRCVTSYGRHDEVRRGNRVVPPPSSSSSCIDVRLSSFVFHAALAGDVGGSGLTLYEPARVRSLSGF